uniref:Uncharacterized protein n=1 Tax=Arundo donax TaxID=35708 RepID=A0A0A9EQH1_ARUDO
MFGPYLRAIIKSYPADHYSTATSACWSPTAMLHHWSSSGEFFINSIAFRSSLSISSFPGSNCCASRRASQACLYSLE